MLSLLIDENFNHRILRGLVRSVPHLDYSLTRDTGLKGVTDPQLLAAAAEQRRILVTHDVNTVPKHAYERVAGGLTMPGVIAVPDDLGIGQAISDLGLLVECCQPSELEHRVLYLPL